MTKSHPEFWGWSTSPLTIAFWGWEDARELVKARRGCISALVHHGQVQWTSAYLPPASVAAHCQTAAKTLCSDLVVKNVEAHTGAFTINCLTSTCSVVYRCNTAKTDVSRAAGKVVGEGSGPGISVCRFNTGSHASRERTIPRIDI